MMDESEMVLSLKFCQHCSIFMDMPIDRQFCPFCGQQTQRTDRKHLRHAFETYGPDLDDKYTYVKITIKPNGKVSYTVIGDVERLKRHDNTA